MFTATQNLSEQFTGNLCVMKVSKTQVIHIPEADFSGMIVQNDPQFFQQSVVFVLPLKDSEARDIALQYRSGNLFKQIPEHLLRSVKAYLAGNAEAKKYTHSISYEDVLDSLVDEYEKAIINHALSDANNVRLPRDAVVTAFWDELYDYLTKTIMMHFAFMVIKGLNGADRPDSGFPYLVISRTAFKSKVTEDM